MRLPLQYCSSDSPTWTGDTHVETNILPSSRLLQKQRGQLNSCAKRCEISPTLMVNSDRHKATLMDEE